MSLERRTELADDIVDSELQIQNFLENQPFGESVMAGSWDLASYSFQNGFEVMWDAVHADPDGILVLPLLSLWRQSIELTLKSTLREIGGNSVETNGHDLRKLFEKLVQISSNLGIRHDNGFFDNVREMIEFSQSFDPYADRFRYPANKKGAPFEGINIDLDKLFQAYWKITVYCEGTAVEISEEFGVG